MNTEYGYSLLNQVLSERVELETEGKQQDWMGKVVRKDVDGTILVDIFGGEKAVPCLRTQMDVQPGDTVNVRIQNGYAVILGCTSSPAAKAESVGEIKETVVKIERQYYEVENLVAEKADIVDLTAAQADISQLQAADVTITGRLDTAEAEVNNLVATKADISDLNAATARIGAIESDYLKTADMQAETARVDNLLAGKASVADLNAAKGRIDDLEADHVSTTDLQTVNASITSLQAEDATINGKLTAAEGDIDTLQANTADIGTIRANAAKVQNLTAAELEADHAKVGTLDATYATIDNLDAATGRIGTLETNTADIGTIRANSAKVKDVTAQQITAATGYISDLTAGNVTAANIISDHAAVGSLDANYAQIDMANVNNAWIANGTIKDGAISSAMINDVSANKLTAGTINGSVINVTNLNADNITTGTINGQRIGEGSLSLDKLSDDVYTESEVDAKLSTMQQQIDGAIETWTGTEVPTLQNAPASSWTTTQLKDQHVGDVYFVVNSQSQQNGYNYRFTKTGSAYSWQLIKDNDVTNALQRLETAEGKITQFDSDISTLKTDTGTLTTRTTSLETRADGVDSALLDKVDTTDFNELSDTVDGHTQTLSQHTTAISNKADSSTVTALTTRVNKNETDISGINTTIGQLQTTVESKADGSELTTVSNKLNTVSDTVDGHTQTISSVQSTLETKADSSTVSTLTTRVSDVEQDVSGFKQTVSETYATKSEAKQTDSDSGKREIATEDAAELPLLTLTAYGECEQDGTPTPDAPISIKAVRGRNLLSLEPFCNLKYNNPVDTVLTEEDVAGNVVIEGTESGVSITTKTSWKGVVFVSDELDTGTYSISGTFEDVTNAGNIRLTRYVLDENKAIVRNLGNYSTAAKYNYWERVVLSETERYIAVAIGATGAGDVLAVEKLLVNRGGIAVSYTPYGLIGLKSRGKNLVPQPNGIVGRIPQEGYNYSNGSTDGQVHANSHGIEVEPNAEYTFSFDNTDAGSTDGHYVALAWYDSDGVFISRPDNFYNRQANSKTYTSPSNAAYARVSAHKNVYPTLQLERGTEATEYEPYRESVSYIDLKGEDVCSHSNDFTDKLTVDASGHVLLEKRTRKRTVTKVGTLTVNSGRTDYASLTATPAGKRYSTAAESYEGLNYGAMQWCDMLSKASSSRHYIRATWNGLYAYSPNSDGLTQEDYDKLVGATVIDFMPSKYWYTIDLGYIDPPTTFDGGTVHVDAEIQPVIDASWWTKAGYETGKAYNDGNGSADLAALTERLTTAESNITQQAGQIALKANAADVNTKAETTALLEVKANKATLTSEINASADTVKIDAARVNIEGAAIFTSGRLSQSSLDGAYDASGAASAAQAAAISAAATDATSKANAAQSAAISAAAADATSKANAAQSAAEATAAADATSKADAARDAAISAAAADATAKANAANAMEQLVYKSAAAGTSSMDGTTTWITSTSDSQNAWTTKRPTYSSDYPVLFVATQRKAVGGTVTCTQPVKDDTTTVIDGGHITTGTIDAARMTASVINAVNNGTGTISADKINASQLTIGQSQVTGLTNALDGKADDADIPTKTSDLTNDSNFASTTQVATAKSEAISAAATDAATKANDAKKYATNYIALDPVNGIRIADANPDTATTYQKQTSTSTEFVVEGTSMAEFGGSGARIGAEDTHQTFVSGEGITMSDNAGETVMNIGAVDRGDSTYTDASGKTTRTLSDNKLTVTFTCAKKPKEGEPLLFNMRLLKD